MCDRSDSHWWKCNDADVSAVESQEVNTAANMGGAMFFFNKLVEREMADVVEDTPVVNERKRRPCDVRRTEKRLKAQQRNAKRYQMLESRRNPSGDN